VDISAVLVDVYVGVGNAFLVKRNLSVGHIGDMVGCLHFEFRASDFRFIRVRTMMSVLAHVVPPIISKHPIRCWSFPLRHHFQKKPRRPSSPDDRCLRGAILGIYYFGIWPGQRAASATHFDATVLAQRASVKG